ncbi:MAG: MerR family transcriptional regulator, partial [Lachnospiraceae bacterium]|nr:MerR family transcriptional regulator [Lachnospiraceae bacterium]
MEKHRAIPEGYMTVGEAAKKMGVTVRTLQYYDRENLLCPSAASEGGRRLYSDKDLIKLHQILSLKSLGFSLDDIKERLIPLDNPADVAKALSEQAAAIRQKMASLSESLQEIETLQKEVLQIQQVDFKKYADIIVNLQMKNEYYFLIKYFDNEMLDHIRSRFDKNSGFSFMDRFTLLLDSFAKLQEKNTPPDNEENLLLATEFLDRITELAG